MFRLLIDEIIKNPNLKAIATNILDKPMIHITNPQDAK